MRYLLDERYRLRGWQNDPTGLYDTRRKETTFLPKAGFLLLMRCDGAHDIHEPALPEKEKKFIDKARERGLIRPAGFSEHIRPEQEYICYPAAFRRQAHWSITGACNLKCLHCFMSAPHARHGSPEFEQLVYTADQLAECGIFHVELTGGEPLIREDLPDLIDVLNEREISVDVISTNACLLDEKCLDGLEKRGVRPHFKVGYDGTGRHDFLRGVSGAESRTVAALKLLQQRGYPVSVSMCLHRGNRDVLRESVNLMASLGADSMKIGSMWPLGEWARPEVSGLRLTRDEELEVFEEYIPHYFEDNAPLTITLSDVFTYSPGDSRWEICCRRECPEGEEKDTPSCAALRERFYIGAEGMVCPCMGMADSRIAAQFPNLFETPLKDILNSEAFRRLCHVTVGEVRDHSSRCRKCRFMDRCTGGCRNAALMSGSDYPGTDPNLCRFFEQNGEARITAAAQGAFEAFLMRNTPGGGMQNPLVRPEQM